MPRHPRYYLKGKFYNKTPKIREDFPCQLLSLWILDKSEPFAGKEKSFREERLEAIQKKEEEKWKRRSLPSAQNEDGRSGFKSMQVILRCLNVFPGVSR